MNYIKSIFSIFIILSIIALSGCIESKQKTFDVISPSEGIVGICQKFTISDNSTDGNVSYKVCWGDGCCTNTRSLPRNAVVPLKHAWLFDNTYNVIITATYDDGSNITIQRYITIKE